MAVRIGKITLSAVRNVHTEDNRSLVQQRSPGQSGGLVQDLGREPVMVVIEGALLGDQALSDLESLRQAQAKAQPLPFAADAVVGTEVTEVIIAELQVKQPAGYKDSFSVLLRVREYTEPPVPSGAGAASVDAAVQVEAAQWGKGAVAAAGVVQNPARLMSAVSADPSVLSHLSPQELSGTLLAAKDSLTGGNFATLLSAVGRVDPSKLVSLFDELKSAHSLGDFVDKLATDGVDLVQHVTGIDLGAARAVLAAVAGGADLLAKLKKVAADLQKIVGVVGHLKPADLFASLGAAPAASDAQQLFAGLISLGHDVAALLAAKTISSLIDLAPKIGGEGIVRTLLDSLCTGLEQVKKFVDSLTTALLIAGFLPGWLTAARDVLDGVSGLLPDEVPAEVSPDRMEGIIHQLRIIAAELPTPAQLSALKDSLTESVDVLKNYATKLVTPSPQAGSK